ncbi:hypothetical protein AVEN_77325-1 [Araneus ventricosus]|uniref:Uncharacterized protein n=1 Tax=Araneus ventricosus TaxID=182803 RepID=A0A4Y2NBR5_ARAVE|nr:hypothetical protein AVEN_77325-1 [Araneus ventricosus]
MEFNDMRLAQQKLLLLVNFRPGTKFNWWTLKYQICDKTSLPFCSKRRPWPFISPSLSLFVKPCSNGVWLGQTSSLLRFALVDYGRGIRTDVPFLLRVALQMPQQRSSGTVRSFDVRAIYRHNAGNTDALTSPRATLILPLPTTGNNANRGRNLWKDRPLERSLRRP